jgi:hypothetical protein
MMLTAILWMIVGALAFALLVGLLSAILWYVAHLPPE